MGSIVTPSRVRMDRQSRFNPLSSLTPQRLTQQLDQFEQGYLWELARTWDAISRRDDKLPALMAKRLGALARYGWEILAVDDDEESQQHKEALEFTFNHLSAVNAVDENDRGGLAQLLRKMGGAIGHRYSASELLWNPVKAEGDWQMSLEARQVPLWFFENTTGRLRFCETPGSTEGKALEEGNWLIACGAGLMEPCGVLYMFKRLPLSDWLNYCEAFGLPGVVGHTTQAQDSPAGQAMAAAVAAIGAQLAFTLYGSDKNSIELLRPDGGSGQLPFPPLIERCDRGMGILWRGADLSTMSAGAGSGEGASLQGNESDLLEQDDAAWASEILQEQIARRVIAWKFGTLPKAYIRIKTKQTPDTKLDLEVCEKAISHGFPVSRKWFSERFGLPIAKEGEELLTPTATPTVNPEPITEPAENDLQKDKKSLRAFLDKSRAHVARNLAKDLQPLREAIAGIVDAPDAELPSRLASFRANAPSLFRALAEGGNTERALAETLAPALLDGLAQPKP